MIKYLAVLILSGCITTTQQPTPQQTVENRAPKYAVGDCLMIVDLPSGKTISPYRVRVEKIQDNSYWYRWLLDNGRWALGLSCLREGLGPCWGFESLEKISKKVSDCPNGG